MNVNRDKGTGLRLAPRYGLHAIPAPGGTKVGQFFYVGTIPVELAEPREFFPTLQAAVNKAASLDWHCGNPTA